MPDLTDRQRLVLREALAYQLEHGLPPTLKGLANAVGLDHATSVLYHLEALKKKGYLKPNTENRTPKTEHRLQSPGWHGAVCLRGVTWQPVFDAESPAGIMLARLYQEITGQVAVDFMVSKEVLG